MASEPKGSVSPHPARIGDRYEVAETIGSGGMASVYRVTDSVTGRQVALKQLTLARDEKRGRESAALFEREFHTLAQLSHPRIIEVYDYGLDQAGPYYTMELLEGEDLRERSPVPWREACALLYDVCSSLALIHSRRLVHRDVSPRNIRCTLDGPAKLIDFGAMAPIGHGGIHRRHPSVRRARGHSSLRSGRAHRSLLARRHALLRADRACRVSGARLLAAVRGLAEQAARAGRC